MITIPLWFIILQLVLGVPYCLYMWLSKKVGAE